LPYLLAIAGLILAGFFFRKVLAALIGMVAVVIALAGACFITFGASVLLLGRVDAILAGGSGWIEVPACLFIWIMAFWSILSFFLPKASLAKSDQAKPGG
jgi:uncharacterized membrane protein